MPRRSYIRWTADPPLRVARVPAGHTLLELLVVLTVIAAASLIGGVGLGRGLEATGSRANAQIWQTAAAAAQLRCLWSDDAGDVVASSERISVSGGDGLSRSLPPISALSLPEPNIRRWNQGTIVRVRFSPWFAAPDAAGSLFFGDQELGQRVVVRLESGLTRRERP